MISSVHFPERAQSTFLQYFPIVFFFLWIFFVFIFGKLVFFNNFLLLWSKRISVRLSQFFSGLSRCKKASPSSSTSWKLNKEVMKEKTVEQTKTIRHNEEWKMCFLQHLASVFFLIFISFFRFIQSGTMLNCVFL